MIKSTEKTTDRVFPPETIAPKQELIPNSTAESIVSPIARQLVLGGEAPGGGILGLDSALIG
jgi:hypothetical protein